MTPILWDAHETARYLHCGDSTVYELVREEALPAHKVAGTLLFDPEEVRRWFLARPLASGQPAPELRLVEDAPTVRAGGGPKRRRA